MIEKVKTKTKKKPPTKVEMRIAIAKDVLKQLAAKKIKAKQRVYGEFKLKALVKEGDDLQTILKTNLKTKSCDACALGAAMISYVRLYDKVKVGEEVHPDDYSPKELAMDRPELTLGKVFPPEQLDLIEAAFEHDGGLVYYSVSELELENAKDFGRHFKSSYNRLKAIMGNIVKNKGTFKP